MAGGHQKLEKVRRQIDAIDDELLVLLNRRAEHSIRVGKIKEEYQLPVFSSQREEELIKRITGKAAGPLNKDAIKNIFRVIMDESKKIQTSTLTANQKSGK